jgi:selenocysteine lyase/cysteine desulfurase
MTELTAADVERLRGETPGCTAVRHLNNAGSSLSPAPVMGAIRAHLDLEERLGGYEAADMRRKDIESTYDAVAGLLGTTADHVAIVENATVGFAQALSAFDFTPGDTIVTTRNDYISNQLLYLSLRDRLGIRVVRAADLPEGGVDPDSVRQLVRQPGVKVVALTWVPTNSGLVQAAESVGAICEDAGVPYVVDACQVVGQMPIDVARLRCDYLSATARKFLRGPRGIGLLYVSQRALDSGAAPLYPDMQGARWTGPDAWQPVPSARRFENWELAYALVLGLGEAARYAGSVGVAAAGRRASALADRLRRGLSGIDGVTVLDRGATRCAITTMSMAGADGPTLQAMLRHESIHVSVIRREHAMLDMTDKDISSGIRLSPHYFNTEGEVDRAIEVLSVKR